MMYQPVSPGQHIVPPGSHRYELLVDVSSLEVQDFRFILNTPESEVRILAKIQAKNQEAPRIRTTVLHTAEKTKAEVLVLNVAKDHSTTRHEGFIQIEPHAIESVSHLRNRSLLLGSHSKTWTRPALEIRTGNVTCSHDATVQTITDEDIFSFSTRGIDPTTAKRTLIHAFFNQEP